MAALASCQRCGVEVPEQNLGLHEVRCGGRGTASPPATGSGAAASRSGAAKVGPAPTGAQIAQALTWARTRPSEVLEALLLRQRYYNGKDYSPPEREGRCVVTKEGTAAVEDAIAYVKALQPMGGVGEESEIGLQLAAEDHVADIGRSGTASHDSSDGTGAGDRARRYGDFSLFGECLWYGSDYIDARAVILDLIVDDGVPSRGHRKGVYNPAYDIVGCTFGPHVTFGNMIAIEFACGWRGKDMFIRARMQSGPVKMSNEVMAKAKANATTQWSLGGCALCGEPIKGGTVMEVPELGGKIHAPCFKCHACSEPLKGKPFRLQAKLPYCTPCYLQRFGDRCAACGEVISGATMKCALGSFHPECVVCTTCGKAIGKASFSTSSRAITCQSCTAGSGSTSSLAAAASRGAPPPKGGAKRTSPLAAAGAGIAAATAKAQAPARPSSSSSVRRPSRAGSPAPKARAGAPAAAAGAKAKAKPAAKPKASMGMAKNTVVGLASDYDGLI